MRVNNINVAFGAHTFKTNKYVLKDIKALNSTFCKGELDGTEVLSFLERQEDVQGTCMYIAEYYPDFYRAVSSIVNEHEILKGG